MSRLVPPVRRTECRFRWSPLLAALVLTAAVSMAPAVAAPPAGPPPNPGGYANTIGPGLYRLDGTDPLLAGGDLEPLRHVVGSARIVGLGESLHTVGSFYEMKHRLFRFLVEEMGFRVLGIENPWRVSDRLNAYVQTCEGTPEAALEALFTNTRSVEVRDLALWMCEWNRSHPHDRVSVYGFDIQRQARPDGEALLAFLERLGVSLPDPRAEGIRACDGVTDVFFPSQPFPVARYEQCQAALGAVERLFDEEEREIVRRTSRDDLAWARIALVGEQSVQEFQFYVRQGDFPAWFAARDRGMAYMTLAIRAQRFPHAKTALWAHNGHLGNLSTPIEPLIPMGDLLRAELGRDYRVLAVVAHETYANWPAVGRCGLASDLLGPRPVEELLHGYGEPALLLDLAPRGSHPSLLGGEDYSMNGSDEPLRLADQFSAIIFLDVARAMNSLLWPPCG